MDDPTVDIRQPEVTSGITIRQTRMINAHQMEDGSVEIVNVHATIYGMHPEFIGRPIGQTTARTGSS